MSSSKSFLFAGLAAVAVMGGLFAGVRSASAEILTLNSLSSAPVNSQPLTSGTVYQVEVTGTYNFNANGKGDADFIFQNLAGFPGSTTPAEDIHVSINNQSVLWLGTTDGTNFAAHTYSPSHIYRFSLAGQGAPVSFTLLDSLYSDNSGSLQVAVTAVPEPASLLVVGLGCGILAMRRRRAAH